MGSAMRSSAQGSVALGRPAAHCADWTDDSRFARYDSMKYEMYCLGPRIGGCFGHDCCLLVFGRPADNCRPWTLNRVVTHRRHRRVDGTIRSTEKYIVSGRGSVGALGTTIAGGCLAVRPVI